MENDNKIENLFKTFGEDEPIAVEDVQLPAESSNSTDTGEQSESVEEEQPKPKEKSPEPIVQKVEVKEEENTEEDDFDFFAEAGIELEEGDDFKITEDSDWADIASRVKTFIEKNKPVQYEDPEVRDFIAFKEIGGTLEEFKVAPKRVDYAATAETLTDDNIDLSEQVVRYALAQKELPEDVIESAINSYKDKGKLVEQAKAILLKEDEVNKQQYDKWIADVNAKNKEYKDSVEKQIKEVKTTIESGKFGGLILSKAEITNFTEGVLKVDPNTGNTRVGKKYDELTVEQRLILDYIVDNDFDFSKIKLTDKTVVKPTVRRVGNIGGKVPKVKTQAQDDQEFEQSLNSIFEKYNKSN